MRFPQYMDPAPGEKVLLVDDVLRSGVLVNEAKTLLERHGADVLGLAVLIYQPTPVTHDFGALPLYTLARLDDGYYAMPGACQLCKRGVPVEKIGREPADRVLTAEAR